MELKKINLDYDFELFEDQEYLLTREGEMSDHTGIYKYSKHYHDNFVLYSEDLQCHYTLPVFAKDLKLYYIKDKKYNDLKNKYHSCLDEINKLYKENENLKESNKELLNMLVKIAYCGWNMKELHELMVKYGYEEKEDDD